MNERQQRRAEKRAQSSFETSDPTHEGPAAEETIRAIALVPDAGGYRMAVLALPVAAAERYTVSVTESEVLSVQLAVATEALEVGVRGDVDADGRATRPTCSRCGAAALVRHPSKPVLMCASCDARHEVSAP